MNIQSYLQSLGYSTVNHSFYNHIDLWREWYKGNVNSFHNYEQYNGVKQIKRTRKRLNMAKKICEDKANLLLNEKVSINIGDEYSQNYVDKVLYENDFHMISNQLIEMTNALGTGAFVLYLENNEINIDTISADCIFPLSWRNGRIRECAFASTEYNGEETQVFLSMHVLEDKEYVIYNKLLVADTASYKGDKKSKVHEMFSNIDKTNKEINISGFVEIPLDDGIASEIHTGSSLPWFWLIKPNIANNIDSTIPMGISIFANSIDVLKGIDLVYDSYDNEFVLGKKRIFIDNSLVQVDTAEGRVVPRFDSNDAVFYALNSLDDESDGIKEIDMSLRITEHELALESRLSTLASNCGFGRNYYQFKNSGVKTATEVMAENNELFRMIKKDEIVLSKALSGVVKSILYIANEFLSADTVVDTEVNIAFDDSIIEDTGELQRRAMEEYKSGLIDDVSYFCRAYAMTMEQATRFVDEINERGGDKVVDVITE